jgi:putative zinc finger protein
MEYPKDERSERGDEAGQHLDEGMVHAWLDGQLSEAEALRVEAHVAACAACAAAVGDARGFLAASSRILTALDGVPSRVVPQQRHRLRPWQIRAAAAVVIAALGVTVVLRDTGGPSVLPRAVGARYAERAAPPEPERKQTPPAPAPSSPPALPGLAPQTSSGAPATEPRRERALRSAASGAPAPAAATNALSQADSAARAPAAKALGGLAGQAGGIVARRAVPSSTYADQLRADVGRVAPQNAAKARFKDSIAVAGVGRPSNAPTSAGARAMAQRPMALQDARPPAAPPPATCVGRVVRIATVRDGKAPADSTAVRLDSAASRDPRYPGFALRASSDSDPAPSGAWVPFGMDSAVVTVPSAATGATESAAVGSDSAPTDVQPSVRARVRCRGEP